MKNVKIIPSNLRGSINIMSSKSLCHRAIIAASLSDGISSIKKISFSKDIYATIDSMKNMGAEIKIEDNNLTIHGNSKPTLTNKEIHCGESGSTLRFLIPVALLAKERVTFTGDGKLVERPLSPYYEIFQRQGISYSKSSINELPLTVDGSLFPGKFQIRGDISSQFITGLMFALPLLSGNSQIIITSMLESKGYVDLTMDVLKKFGINILNNDYDSFYIKGNQQYNASNYTVEGDFSQAAFFLAAGVLGEGIECRNLNIDSIQGDKEIINIIERMGGNLCYKENSIIAKPSKLKGTIIDASECPDLVPIVAVLGAMAEGSTKIVNAKRLRIKESDRLRAIASGLNNIGADVREFEDSLIIEGKKELKGGEIESFNDHRIAMALSIASIRCKENIIIKNSDAVSKSYPNFFEDFQMLGGKVYECSMG